MGYSGLPGHTEITWLNRWNEADREERWSEEMRISRREKAVE